MIKMDELIEGFFKVFFEVIPPKISIPIAILVIGGCVYGMSLQEQAGLRKSFPNVRIESSMQLTKWWNPFPILEVSGTDSNGKTIVLYSGSAEKSDWSQILGKVGACYNIVATRENVEEQIFTIESSDLTICNGQHPKR
jgi:hypothetical protein